MTKNKDELVEELKKYLDWLKDTMNQPSIVDLEKILNGERKDEKNSLRDFNCWGLEMVRDKRYKKGYRLEHYNNSKDLN